MNSIKGSGIVTHSVVRGSNMSVDAYKEGIIILHAGEEFPLSYDAIKNLYFYSEEYGAGLLRQLNLLRGMTRSSTELVANWNHGAAAELAYICVVPGIDGDWYMSQSRTLDEDDGDMVVIHLNENEFDVLLEECGNLLARNSTSIVIVRQERWMMQTQLSRSEVVVSVTESGVALMFPGPEEGLFACEGEDLRGLLAFSVICQEMLESREVGSFKFQFPIGKAGTSNMFLVEEGLYVSLHQKYDDDEAMLVGDSIFDASDLRLFLGLVCVASGATLDDSSLEDIPSEQSTTSSWDDEEEEDSLT